MIKKVNKNKFGVIEYSITNAEDLKDLPKGDSDNSVYAVDDDNKVYLYSKKANDYILINGGGAANPNEFTIKRIDMGDPETEVDYESFDGDGYYSVLGSIDGNCLTDSIVLFSEIGNNIFLTLYEHCKHIFAIRGENGMIQYNSEELFEPIATIGSLYDLPSGLQDCGTLVEAIGRIYNMMSKPS